jgi:putative DNA primase/helicase
MAATSNIPLKVPFKEKDEAKSHGARWNPDGKHWYIPVGVEEAPFEKWVDGAPTEMTQPQAAPQGYSQQQGTTQAKPASTLPAKADMDDINAMLRDAFEVGED